MLDTIREAWADAYCRTVLKMCALSVAHSVVMMAAIVRPGG